MLFFYQESENFRIFKSQSSNLKVQISKYPHPHGHPEGGSLPLGGLSAENVDNILCDEEVPDSTFRKLGTQLN